jgi:four helix bundle protein
MSGARSFTELRFWQKARIWSRDIFHHTQRPPFARDQRLVVQINDSSESVMANMAEGFGRGTQEEFITFLGYAIGSLDETQSHLVAAYDRNYLTREVYATLFREGTAIYFGECSPADGSDCGSAHKSGRPILLPWR